MGRNRLVTAIVVCVFVFSTLFIANPIQMIGVEAALSHGLAPVGPGNNTTSEDAAGAPYDAGPSGDFEVIWSPLSNPHYIEDDYTVEMGWNLIIQPGCDIRFQPGTRITVHGGLTADGTLIDIKFTSNQTTKSPGDWEGIYVDGGFLNTFNNCTLEYATDGMYFRNMGMLGSIQNSRFHDNTNYGVYLDFVMGGPWVARNEFYNCSYGVYSRSSSLQLNTNEVFNNSYGVYLGIVPGMGPIGPSLIFNNITNNRFDGVHVAGEMPSIQNNYISDNGNHGVYLEDDPSVIFPWSWMQDNVLEDNVNTGIWVQGTVTNIMNNTILNGTNGIVANASADIWVEESWIEKAGVGGEGITFKNSFGNITTTTIRFGNHGISSDGSFFNVTESRIENWGSSGVYASGGSEIYMENSTMFSSAGSSFVIQGDSHVTTLNTSFNKQSVVTDPLSNLTVMWWVHIKVNESDGDPAQGALVWLNNTFGDNVFSGSTDTLGFIKWIKVTEYIDGFGAIDFDTHIAAAINGSEFGVTFADIDFSKTIYIDLGSINDFQVPLLLGWNMISVPLNQSDTTLGIVLGSIAGNYRTVQWFDATDPGDLWKHSLVGKPFGNDLFDIHHKMGMWIYMDTPDNLNVQGDLLATTDTPLYTGWNFVGYPSLKTRTVGDALSSIAGQYDAIWYYNASDAGDHWKSEFDGDLTEMGSGAGYWIHATEDTVWSLDGY
jgi:hypothetical protein